MQNTQKRIVIGTSGKGLKPSRDGGQGVALWWSGCAGAIGPGRGNRRWPPAGRRRSSQVSERFPSVAIWWRFGGIRRLASVATTARADRTRRANRLAAAGARRRMSWFAEFPWRLPNASLVAGCRHGGAISLRRSATWRTAAFQPACVANCQGDLRSPGSRPKDSPGNLQCAPDLSALMQLRCVADQRSAIRQAGSPRHPKTGRGKSVQNTQNTRNSPGIASVGTRRIMEGSAGCCRRLRSGVPTEHAENADERGLTDLRRCLPGLDPPTYVGGYRV